MPVMGGFELLTQLSGGLTPAIVMVTAFDEHAIRAFEAGTVDYLLKPVSQSACNRRSTAPPVAIAIQWLWPGISPACGKIAGVSAEPRIRKIVGKAGEEFFLLDPDEILAFQAAGDLVWIVTSKQRYLATQNLKTLEERLGSGSFRRVHRNALVNMNQIRKMSMMTSQRWLITLNNGQEFIVSKRQARNVRDVLHW